MDNKQDFIHYVDTCISKIKDTKVESTIKPEELKLIFNNVLRLKNDYWEMNRDSNKLTKLGMIFKPDKTNIQKGKPIYVALLFEVDQVKILLEEQYARTDNNTFEILYDLMIGELLKIK